MNDERAERVDVGPAGGGFGVRGEGVDDRAAVDSRSSRPVTPDPEPPVIVYAGNLLDLAERVC